MSEHSPGENLSPFEAQLAELMPRPAEVGRDEILFEAGRQDALRQHRRVLYKWHAACAVLLVVVCGQWIWLPHSTPSENSPLIAETSTSGESPNALANSLIVAEEPEPSPPVRVEPIGSGSVPQVRTPTRSPLIWGQLIPSPSTTPAAIAMGNDLSVGSSIRGIALEAFATPKPGSIPADDEPILSPMHRIRLAE